MINWCLSCKIHAIDKFLYNVFSYYQRKVPKCSDAKNVAVIHLKFETKRPNLKVFCRKHANGMANSVNLDQTAPLGAV